jgi:hypothetical protein
LFACYTYTDRQIKKANKSAGKKTDGIKTCKTPAKNEKQPSAEVKNAGEKQKAAVSRS